MSVGLIIIGIVLAIILILILKLFGNYPEPLPSIKNQREEIRDVLIIWIVFTIYLVIFIFVLRILFPISWGDRYLGSLLVLTFGFFLIPLWYIIRKDKIDWRELGLTKKVESLPVAIFGIVGYVIIGILSFFLLDTMEVGLIYLIILLYSNAFLEEFIFRGVIQTKLERATGQKKAIMYQGIIFVLIHIPYDILLYSIMGDLLYVVLLFILQFIHGLIYGLIFMKTRNLFVNVICHFLTNWTGATILLFLQIL
ncbi:MAG: lysostaphin resistance A-like protein [Promethearchaeota archaeon]